jgi:hypothetical protein
MREGIDPAGGAQLRQDAPTQVEHLRTSESEMADSGGRMAGYGRRQYCAWGYRSIVHGAIAIITIVILPRKYCK